MHLDREIEALKGRTLSLAARVEDALRNALKSVKERDATLAQRVIDSDAQIDGLEVALEEECLKVLALHQPVANDLRFIISIIKVTNELERIGDLASDVAERAVALAEHEPQPIPAPVASMAPKTQAMVKKALDALVNMAPDLAREVCASDDEIDDCHRAMFAHAQEWLRRSPEDVEVILPWLSISRYLERVGDHATNIAEDVIYSVEGHIVRHRAEQAAKPTRR
jgi:phosphate transport system protein